MGAYILLQAFSSPRMKWERRASRSSDCTRLPPGSHPIEIGCRTPDQFTLMVSLRCAPGNRAWVSLIVDRWLVPVSLRARPKTSYILLPKYLTRLPPCMQLTACLRWSKALHFVRRGELAGGAYEFFSVGVSFVEELCSPLLLACGCRKKESRHERAEWH